MGWPDSGFLWRENAKPAQKQYTDVAKAISQFEPVVILANPEVITVAPVLGLVSVLLHCDLASVVCVVGDTHCQLLVPTELQPVRSAQMYCMNCWCQQSVTHLHFPPHMTLCASSTAHFCIHNFPDAALRHSPVWQALFSIVQQSMVQLMLHACSCCASLSMQ